MLVTVYAAPIAIIAIAYGAVRRRRWALPALAGFLAWCVVATALHLAAEDDYRGNGISNWSAAGPDAQRWLLGLGVVAAVGAAVAVLARRRPAARATLVGGVAAGSLVGSALVVVALMSGLN